MQMKEKKYLRDVVGENYKKWKPGDIIAFDAGMGSGKTAFILKTLSEYAWYNAKTILYLCPRSPLKGQVNRDYSDFSQEMFYYPGIDNVIKVMTYQKIQENKQARKEVENYDYIVADECHYFYSDAGFNDKTDIAYEAVMNQPNAVVILMSATAKGLFEWLKEAGTLKEENIYRVPGDFSYISHLYFYKNDALITLIDQILSSESETKILVFTSVRRIKRLYGYYGDKAYYYSSIHSNDKFMQRIRDPNCIVPKDDGIITFDKRILFTTSVLDVGINLKDRQIKHIFCELVNTENLIQAIGRKRSLDNLDTVDVYVKKMQRNWIDGKSLIWEKNQLEMAELFMYKKEDFLDYTLQNRKAVKSNPIFYNKKNKDGTNAELAVNLMKYRHFLIDYKIREEILQSDYKTFVVSLFGDDIKNRVEELKAATRSTKDDVLQYLKSIEGKKIIDRTELLNRMSVFGDRIKDKNRRTQTINGLIADEFPNYEYRFTDQDENGKPLRLRDTALGPRGLVKQRGKEVPYWILKHI